MRPALTEVDLEVIHFHRTIVPGNWKDWQSTNMDPYHEFMHAVVRQTLATALEEEPDLVVASAVAVSSAQPPQTADRR